MPARSDNPDGFWENLQFVAINDEVLNQLGGAWDLPPPADADFKSPRLDPLRIKARLQLEKFNSVPAWGWKDPRNCLTFRFWRDLLPSLKVLLVVRNPLEVAYSMEKRNGTSYSFGLRLWEIYNRRLLGSATGEELLITHYDSFFEDPESELRRVTSFIGLTSSEITEAAASVTKNRRHTHFTIEQMVDARVAGKVIELYQELIAQSKQNRASLTNREVPAEMLPGSVSRLNTSVPEAEDVRRELAWLRGAEMKHREELARRDGRIIALQENVERQEEARTTLERRYMADVFQLGVREQELVTSLQATKKLVWFLKETEKTATRLRSSRRWKIGNPFAALREAFGGRKLAGYGHLDKIVSDYSKWCSDHPELKRIEERIQALNQQMARSAIGKSKTSLKLSAPYEPPLPARPIEFPACEAVEVSIIIPVYNQLRFTQSCLASIQDNQADQSLEVIVVDDSSTDGTEETLPRIPGLVYLRNEENVGFVASCNRGAAKARGNYLVFLNNDTVVTAGWLSALRETFQFEPHAGLVGSKLIYPDGRLQEAGGIIWRDGSGWNRGKFDDPRKPEYNFLCEVDYCSAACLMLPKSLFQRIGGFDSRYVPAYYEDTDLAFKVRAAGFKVLYQPLSEVFHFEGATGGTDISTGTKKHQEINRKAFAAKWKEALATKPANGDVAALEQLPQGYKRILIIDHSLPMPDRDSGSLRMFQILTILHQLGHRVTFIPHNLANIHPYASELRKHGIEVFLRPHITDVTAYIEAQAKKYDAVILSRCGTAKKHIGTVRLHAPRSHVIFDTVDLHFLRTAREAELTQKAEAKMLAEQTQEQEYSLIKEADETWVVSEAERELLLHDFPGKQIEVVSNIVNIQAPKTSFAERADFLFIGSFLHPPNVDAVLYFVNDIYPLVAQTLPAVKFYIIGHQAPPEIVALGSENIIVVGAVPEVLSFFESVKLSVAPLRYGAGVKGKINQSMGLGVPVVATSIAVEGMLLEHGEDVLIGDTPSDFADAVVELYRNEQLWSRLSRNSLKKTEAFYSVSAARQRLQALTQKGDFEGTTDLTKRHQPGAQTRTHPS